MMFSKGYILNFANNRLECINYKLKSVISRHFNATFLILRAMHSETNHKAAFVSQKVQIYYHLPTIEYTKLLTPYACEFVDIWLEKGIVKSEKTSTVNSFIVTYKVTYLLHFLHIYYILF